MMMNTDIKRDITNNIAKGLNIGKEETIKSYKEFTVVNCIKAAIYSILSILFYFTISNYINIRIANTLLLWCCVLACVYWIFNAVKFMFPRYLIIEHIFNRLIRKKKNKMSLPKFRGL